MNKLILKSAFLSILFLLSASGNAQLSEIPIIDYGSGWAYYDNANEPPLQGSIDWNDLTYDASSWAIGDAHLGYGDGDEVTVINNATETVYLRHSFTVLDPSEYESLTLNLTYDDGAVIYLNGSEVWRVNMPTGNITYSTFAASTSSENAMAISPLVNSLQTGINIIAVEVHQRSSSSSDISFDFEMVGNPPGVVNVLRGPYLQKGTPTSMTIKWRTLAPTESIVNYGSDLGSLNQTIEDLTLRIEHEIEITGLNADSKYYYNVANSAGIILPESSDQFFVTHPLAGSAQPYTFWVLGDCGTANSNQRAVRDAYYNYIGTNHTDGILFLGDNAYNSGTDNEYQFAMFENMYEGKLKNSVAWSTLGNHDGYSANSNAQTGPYYDIFTFPTAGESGGMASGTEAYYSFDYGNIHFIVLESYETDRSIGGAMYNWAQSDIQNTTQEWIVAFWHHPPYTKGSHDSDTESNLIEMRQNFLPMLEANGADLILNGHSHSYERSYFLNGHYGSSNTFDNLTHTVGANGFGDGKVDGTGAYEKASGNTDGAVYVVTGSAGKISGGSLDHNAMYYSVNQLGSCILEVDGTTLNLKFIRETGSIEDYFTIEKSAGCTVGETCDDGDPCTVNDELDANCDCVGTALPDTDGDGICDDEDNCSAVSNPSQEDADSDGTGDACDACPNDSDNDIDGDGVCGDVDNCPTVSNPTQTDADGDGIGDICDACPNDPDNDIDGDGVCGDVDNCPTVSNPTQADADGDGIGDICDACPNDVDNDIDGDGVCGDVDNCPTVSNPSQVDSDNDGIGDVCDTCPNDVDNDIDGDGVCGDVDNCPTVSNPSQTDSDNDGIGDVCDTCPNDADNDIDGDGVCGDVDNCPTVSNPSQIDSDGDGIGDICDICEGFDDNIDTDGDGIPDGCDGCEELVENFAVNPLTHSGSGSNSTTLTFQANSQDVVFTISEISQKTNGKPSKQYIELVTVTYVDGTGTGHTYGNYSGANVSSATISISGIVQSVTVSLTDGQDGNSGSSLMSVTFSPVGYCGSTAPCTTPDADGDGVCDAMDVCPGFDDNVDSDSDGVPDGCDICPGFNDTADGDSDGVPDGCDICSGFDDNVDSDGDGVPDGCDICAGFDDNIDTDGDGIPDGCDNNCEIITSQFPDNPLTHIGTGSSSTDLDFGSNQTDVNFTISDLNAVTSGKPTRRYIDQVTVTYIDVNGATQTYGTFSGNSVSSVNVSISEEIQSVSVALSDGYDGNSGTLQSIVFSSVTSCDVSVQYRIRNTDNLQDYLMDNVLLYPNPTTGRIYVDFGEYIPEFKVSLKNLIGQTLLESIFSDESKISIDLGSSFNGSMYLLQIEVPGHEMKVYRLIKL